MKSILADAVKQHQHSREAVRSLKVSLGQR